MLKTNQPSNQAQVDKEGRMEGKKEGRKGGGGRESFGQKMTKVYVMTTSAE